MAHRRHGALTIAVASLIFALLPSAVAAAEAHAAKPSDFNGDGYVDLAIGVLQDGRGGGVNVLYGSATGLSAAGDQLWNLDSPGIAGTADQNEGFGAEVASGDFDGDGFADLAVVTSGEDAGTEPIYGSVTIIYGSGAGLSASGSQTFKDDDIGPVHGPFGIFGAALAAGDYDGDGYLDLAVGVDWGGPDTGIGFGAVDILFGGPDGLTSVGAMQVTQATPAVPGLTDESVGFGDVLSAGDFSGDGIDDLAIGRPNDSLTGDDDINSGSVNVLYGTADGLSTDGAQLWSQATPGIVGVVGKRDFFGAALATGDFDDDGFADLAVGSPGDRLGGVRAGSVTVIYGSASGLSANESGLWHQGTAGVPGTNEVRDDFGKALAAGDLDGDGKDDLAVGTPSESVGRLYGAGTVTVLYGSSSGIRAARSVSFTQDSPGVPGTAEGGDWFGGSLAVGDFGRSGREDLAIGAYNESIGGVPWAGVVDVLYGRASGISGRNAQDWSQASPGVKGTIDALDGFGFALAP